MEEEQLFYISCCMIFGEGNLLHPPSCRSRLLGIAFDLLSRWTKVRENALDPWRLGDIGAASSLSLEAMAFLADIVKRKRPKVCLSDVLIEK